MNWTVITSKRVQRLVKRLPLDIQARLTALIDDLEDNGYFQPSYQNFGKLSDNRYHCHIKKGNPTYVVVWEINNKDLRIIEVTYAGTHENAPY